MNHDSSQRPRIDLWLLVKYFVLLLIVPVAIGLTIDTVFDTLPVVSIGVIVVFFPMAAYILSKTSLRELDRVIAEVAPPAEETDEVES